MSGVHDVGGRHVDHPNEHHAKSVHCRTRRTSLVSSDSVQNGPTTVVDWGSVIELAAEIDYSFTGGLFAMTQVFIAGKANDPEVIRIARLLALVRRMGELVVVGWREWGFLSCVFGGVGWCCYLG